MFALTIPCEIGDIAWGIRNIGGVPHINGGRIDKMYFASDMSLIICIRNGAKGTWGTSIFPTLEAAKEYLSKQNQN